MKITVDVEFHKTGSISINKVRFGPSLLITRVFQELKKTIEKGDNHANRFRSNRGR